MTDQEIIEKFLFLEKTNAPYKERDAFFKLIPEKYTIEVCAGCGLRTDSPRDCGCPCGTAFRLKQNWKQLIAEVNRIDCRNET